MSLKALNLTLLLLGVREGGKAGVWAGDEVGIMCVGLPLLGPTWLLQVPLPHEPP